MTTFNGRPLFSAISALLLSTLGIATACSSNAPFASKDGQVAPDAGVAAPDGGRPGLARCTNPKPSPGRITTVPPAEDDGGTISATRPLRPMLVRDHGGPVLAQPRWVPIFYPNDSLQSDLEAFLGSVGCTDYWHSVAFEYGVGEAVMGRTTVLTESPPAAIRDEQIREWLTSHILDGTLEAPTPGSTYVIYYPDSTQVTLTQSGRDLVSCQVGGFGAYHLGLHLPDGRLVAYVVVPRCKAPLDSITVATSHEVVEAATNPDESNPAYMGQTFPDDEIADLCSTNSSRPAGFPFEVQAIFSNQASALGHEGCVPRREDDPVLGAEIIGTDDIVVAGETVKGVFVPSGSSKTVKVHVFADPDAGPVSVRTSGILGTATLDKDTARGGEELNLTLSVDANAPHGKGSIAIFSATSRGSHIWQGILAN
jgi:hypothetical protein